MSEHGSEENCTPIERPAGAIIHARRKMFLDDEARGARSERVAARAEQRTPSRLSKLPRVSPAQLFRPSQSRQIPSLDRASSVGPGPPPRNCVVAGAPVIVNTPSTFPSLSVTATVTARFNAGSRRHSLRNHRFHFRSSLGFLRSTAAVAVCEISRRSWYRAGSSGGPPPTCPMANAYSVARDAAILIPISTSPTSARPSGNRTMIEVIHSCRGTFRRVRLPARTTDVTRLRLTAVTSVAETF